jgi:hypothetical protein
MEVNSKKAFLTKHAELKKIDYEKILKEFAKVFYSHLFKGKTIETYIGDFEIIRFKPTREFKKKPIDFKASREEGYIIRYLNEHTDGYACKIVCNLKDAFSKYKFKASRVLARTFAKHLLENPKAYKLYYEASQYKHSNIQTGAVNNRTTPDS